MGGWWQKRGLTAEQRGVFCKSLNVCCVIYSVAIFVEFLLLFLNTFKETGGTPARSVEQKNVKRSSTHSLDSSGVINQTISNTSGLC